MWLGFITLYLVLSVLTYRMSFNRMSTETSVEAKYSYGSRGYKTARVYEHDIPLCQQVSIVVAVLSPLTFLPYLMMTYATPNNERMRKERSDRLDEQIRESEEELERQQKALAKNDVDAQLSRKIKAICEDPSTPEGYAYDMLLADAMRDLRGQKRRYSR